MIFKIYKAYCAVNFMSFYSIMVVELSKKNSSLRCLAGFNERTATMGLKKCLSIIDCSREYWTIYSSMIQQVSESDEGVITTL